jgi:hypothetical protein
MYKYYFFAIIIQQFLCQEKVALYLQHPVVNCIAIDAEQTPIVPTHIESERAVHPFHAIPNK